MRTKNKIKNFALIITFALFIICESCVSNEILDGMEMSENAFTRAAINEDKNKVPLQAVQMLIDGLSQSLGSVPIENHVKCIVDDKNDTLFYVSNDVYGGWTLYSSDSRIPAIIMQSDEGSFESFAESVGSRLWINSMMDYMKLIKQSSDEELSFSESEIETNRNFWKSIIDPNTFFLNGQNKKYSKPEINPGISPTPIPQGHYEYSHSYKIEVVYDSVPRIITTNWNESEPYNAYCPFKSDLSGRAPAGRIAIAAAQVMYYTNRKFGVPQKAPSEAYCAFNVTDSIYVWDQTNYTEAIWSQMESMGIAAAPLIANIGSRLNMRYTDSGAIANPKDLVKKVFKPYGINSSYMDYDVETLKSNLLNRIPVIIEARDKYDVSPTVFIADRYKRSRYQTTNYYVWVYDNVKEGQLVPYVRDSLTYSYSTPIIDNIGFNWGDGYIEENEKSWYPIMGDWRPYGFPYDYNANRKMICFDFSDLTSKQ